MDTTREDHIEWLKDSTLGARAIYDGNDERYRDFARESKLTLTDASFRGTNLENSSFEGLNLDDADFTGANLHNCNFKSCSLVDADFSNADISGITLTLGAYNTRRLTVDDDGVNWVIDIMRHWRLSPKARAVLDEAARKML